MASFVPPLALSARPRYGSTCSRAPRWAMTSAEIVRPAQPKRPREAALQQPAYIAETPLLAALYRMFSQEEDLEKALTGVVSEGVQWDMPLFTNSSKKEIIGSLGSFLRFAIQPALTVHSCEQGENEVRFSWTLSFIYPLPWRPPVNVGGRTTANIENGVVTEICDEWAVSPLALLAQTLPTLADIAWLWPAPHAETDAGIRKVLKKEKAYEIVEIWPRIELRMSMFLSEGDRTRAMSVPALPGDIFEGGLRKKELYWTSSPVSVRELGDGVYEWAAMVPGGLCGSAQIQMKKPIKEHVRVERVDLERYAVVKVSDYVTQDKIKEAMELVQADKDDEVWVRSYDAKIGFNSAGLVSLAMYGATQLLRRRSEIWVRLKG